jgi:hypothetical protein
MALTQSETLRDLARRVDVRKPILPPPDLAPSLLAAADELERAERKRLLMQAELDRLRPVIEAARALRSALDGA